MHVFQITVCMRTHRAITRASTHNHQYIYILLRHEQYIYMSATIHVARRLHLLGGGAVLMLLRRVYTHCHCVKVGHSGMYHNPMLTIEAGPRRDPSCPFSRRVCIGTLCSTATTVRVSAMKHLSRVYSNTGAFEDNP